LENLRRKASMLHVSNVEKAYREAYVECAPVAGRIPKAAYVQSLVMAWKVWRSMMDNKK
jgi:hypothetical protein